MTNGIIIAGSHLRRIREKLLCPVST